MTTNPCELALDDAMGWGGGYSLDYPVDVELDATEKSYMVDGMRLSSKKSVQPNWGRILECEESRVRPRPYDKFLGFVHFWHDQPHANWTLLPNNAFGCGETAFIAFVQETTKQIGGDRVLALLSRTLLSGSDVRPLWLYCAVTEQKEGYEDSAIERIYDEIDKLLHRGKFPELNADLSVIDPDDIPIDLTLAVIIATLPAKSKLPNRAGLVEKYRDYLRRAEEDADDILRGLK